jgi:hypothetical protein
MPTDYLFTWKPGHWPYSELQRLVASFESGGPAVEPWRCQAHRKIRIGDNAYMVKLGDSPRGIFGVGTITGAPYSNPNASDGENPWLVPITFDLLVDPTKSLLMPESNLATLDTPKHRWHPQGSGITLEATAARAIDRFVNRKNKFREPVHEIPHSASAVEESVRAVIPGEHLLDVLGMLARSIQMADQFAPEKWGVRISRKNIMLKVGFVEVLQFHNDLFHQLVRGDLVPRKARSVWHDNFDGAPYKNAPACDTFDADLSISKKAYELLLPAHEAAIEIAARSPIHTTTKNDHSPSLVNFISSMVKIPLPQPAYIETSEQTVLYPDEIADHKNFIEGATISVLVNRYERDPAARNKCVEHYGTDCAACGNSFGDHYGSDMSGFIHIHHLSPLSSIRGQRTVDPIHDLRPVCPNCHAVIHSSNPPLTLDQVRSLIRKHGKLRGA